MLTYKELRRILDKYNLSVSRDDYEFVIRDKNNEIIASVNRKSNATYQLLLGSFADDLSTDEVDEIIKAISQFACSPIDERDIQQKYYLKSLKTGNYLKRIPTFRGGYTTTRYTDKRDAFTEEEVEKIVEEFSAKFEKIKVQDDIGLITKWRKLYMVTADTYDGDYDDHGSEICFFGVYASEEKARERVEFLKNLGRRYAGYREVRLNADEWQFLGGYIDD